MLINLILITIIILIQNGVQTFAAYKQAVLKKPVMQYYNIEPIPFRGEMDIDIDNTIGYWLEKQQNSMNYPHTETYANFIIDRYRDIIIESLLEAIQKHLVSDPSLIAIDIGSECYNPKIRFASKIAFFQYEKERTLSFVFIQAMNNYPRKRFF